MIMEKSIVKRVGTVYILPCVVKTIKRLNRVSYVNVGYIMYTESSI